MEQTLVVCDRVAISERGARRAQLLATAAPPSSSSAADWSLGCLCSLIRQVRTV